MEARRAAVAVAQTSRYEHSNPCAGAVLFFFCLDRDHERLLLNRKVLAAMFKGPALVWIMSCYGCSLMQKELISSISDNEDLSHTLDT